MSKTHTEYALMRTFSDEREDSIATTTTYRGHPIYTTAAAIEIKRNFDNVLPGWDPKSRPENVTHVIVTRQVTTTEWEPVNE